MILFALFFALFLYSITKYFESYLPIVYEANFQTGARNVNGTLSKEYRKEDYFKVVLDPKEYARKEFEIASQRIAVYLYQVSRRSINGLNYEPSFQELWSFLGSFPTGDINLYGSTSSTLNLATLRDGSYGRFLVRQNTLFSEIAKYQYEYDLRELNINTNRNSYGYEDFIKVK